MFNERCDGHHRRDVLRVGGLTALGLGLGRFASLRNVQAAESRTSAKRAILIWLDGGPSHLETFDPKPDAPMEVRGPLESIATRVPGIAFCESLPETAKRAERVAVVRSMTSPLGEHNFGTHYLMTGYRPTPVLEYPSFTGVGAHLRPGETMLPQHVAVPNHRVGGGRFTGAGYLPSDARPFSLEADPASRDFRVRDLDLPAGLDLQRIERRRRYTERIDALGRTLDARSPGSVDPELEQAYRLLASPEARGAFDIHEESPATRNRYGRKSIGQSCLLARRLVEAGVPFVTVNDRGWDTHENLYTRLKEGYTGAKVPVGLVPSLDLALSALLDDLADRRLLDETLVVVMGEFGRTPKLNTRGGRDHWPRVFSVLLAGGGVNGGQVVGASDAVGESPAEQPVTPSDLVATIYTLLGIDPETDLHTSDGRPVRLVPHEAKPVSDLVG